MASPPKIVLITGGSSGIGRATAKMLLAKHYQPVNIDIAPPAEDDSIPYIQCDISQAGQMDEIYKMVLRKFGKPSILISAAGINIHERLSEGDPEKWQRIFEVNVLGAMRFVRAFVNDLNNSDSHIVFMSSVAARKFYSYGGVYSASKAALEAYAETLRLELQPNTKVSVIAAGAVDTSFFQNTLGGPQEYSKLPYRKVLPEDIAQCILQVLMAPEPMNLDYIVVRPRDQEL